MIAEFHDIELMRPILMEGLGLFGSDFLTSKNLYQMLRGVSFMAYSQHICATEAKILFFLVSFLKPVPYYLYLPCGHSREPSLGAAQVHLTCSSTKRTQSSRPHRTRGYTPKGTHHHSHMGKFNQSSPCVGLFSIPCHVH